MKTAWLDVLMMLAAALVLAFLWDSFPRHDTRVETETRVVTQPPADYAALKGENRELRARLDLGLAASRRVPKSAKICGDDVARWLNAGAYRAYRTCD